MKFLSPINVDGYVAADHLKLSQTTAESVNIAEIVWNAVDGTFDMGLLNGVTLQSGQEMHFYGKASGAIANGQAVMFAGSEGDHILMAVAEQGTINANPEYFIGIATQDFTNNQFGYVTVLGKVRGLDTTVYASAVLYYNSNPAPIGPGLLTATQPEAPYAKISVAAVIRIHATQGILMVRPHIMPRIKDLQDVYAPSPSNNNGLFWNSATLRYETKSIPTVLGYTPQDAATAITTSNIGSQSVNYANSAAVATNADYANSAGYAGNAGTLDGYDSSYFYPASNPNGYISSYTETDPTVPSYVKSITATEKSNWNTAYGWGNHALAGYVPQSRTITINGVGYDLSANRSWTISATAVETDTLATVTARGATTSTLSTFDGGLNIGNAKLRWAANSSPTLGFPFTGGPNAFWIDVNDGDTGGIAIDNDGTTIYGAGDTGHVFRVIDEDVYQGTSNIDASTTFRIQQGQNGGGYVRGIFEVTDYLTAGNSLRAPVFYDSSDSGFYLDPNSTTTSLVVAGAIKQNNTLARPCVQWGQSGNVTGALVIKLPGTSPGNYGMIHAVIDVYEYNSNNVCTITIGGHNWSSQWYNYGAEVVGNTNKQVRLGIKDGKYCIVLGDGSSTWEYGQVVLRKIQNGTYYSGVMDLGGAYSIGIESDSYSWISGNLNTFSSTNIIATSAAYSPIYYDNNNTGYYVDPASTSNLYGLTVNQTISGNLSGRADRAIYLDPNYVGGQQTNPQTYFNNGVGVKVAMTAQAGYWSDTLWINGYSGGDVPWMCALHTQRNSQPRMYISAQQHTSSSYGTLYEFWTGYNMDAPNKSGTSYYQTNTWMQFNGAYGLYWPNNNGTHIHSNDGSTYTQVRIQGSKNGYGGIFDSYSSVNGFMYDSAGNGGIYREANGRWYLYHHVGNNCTGISTSTTSGSYRAYIGGSLYAEGDIVAYSDRRKKENIVTVDNALDTVNKLRGVYYNRIDDDSKRRQVGVIAQETQEVLPEVVTYAEDIDEYGVAYGNITGVLIEAIKEQQTQIEELKQLVNQLINK